MANEEALVLDGVALNDGTTLGMVSLSMPPPRQRQDWIGAADSEDQKLVRNPLHENRRVTARIGVIPQASMDAAHDKIVTVLDKLQKASKYTNGISLTWTPATGTRTVTFDVLSGEITDLPIDWESGWLALAPEFTIELTCKPYWRGVEFTTVTDAFGANSIGDYTFDAGAAGNVTITGGVIDAVNNLTTENRFYHSASPYNVTNSRVTVKHALGTTVTSYKAGVILKRIDASNYLIAYVDDNGTNSRLRIDRVISGSTTNLQSTNLAARLSASTAYWVRARIEGNTVYAEHWTSAPTITGTPTLSNTTTLAGGDATALGSGVAGRAGLVWTPQQTAATLDDLEIAPNVFASSTPFVTGELANVGGDVPALGRLIVTDSASQSRRHVEWGLEGPLTYNSATSLLVDSDDMVTSGFAGAQSSATSGAYDPNASGNSSILATLYLGQLVAVCGTGNLSHVGTFRVKARVTTNLNTQVRLTYQVGDGPFTSNEWAANPIDSRWVELDLGTIVVPAVASGTQRWTGRIDAYPATVGGGIAVDYLELIPVSDGYGKARAQYSYSTGVIVGFDSFVGTSAGSNLNARTADLGGSWATSGDATDFVFDDNFNSVTPDGIESIIRSTSSAETTGRFAILGSSTFTDMQVDVRARAPGASGGATQGLVARWTDSSNHLRLMVPNAGSGTNVKIEQVVAGVVTVLDQSTWTRSTIPPSFSVPYRFRLIVFASGRVIGQIFSDAGQLQTQLEATSSALATGGTLQNGKPGVRDQATATNPSLQRRLTEFSVSTPVAEPVAVYSGRTMQIRDDDTIRDDSTGTYTGRPQSYRGSRFLAPVGTSRVMVKARRADIETTPDDNVTDSTTIQVAWTPRGLVVPRS